MNEADALWDDYYEADDDEERIQILGEIESLYDNAWECFSEADDAYCALTDELEELGEETDCAIDEALQTALNAMNDALGTMNVAKGISEVRSGNANAAWDDANTEKTLAEGYSPCNQAAYDALMQAGNAKFMSGNGLLQEGDSKANDAAKLITPDAPGTSLETFVSRANDVQNDRASRIRAANSALGRASQITPLYTNSKQAYEDAIKEFTELGTSAWAKFHSARLQ